MEKAARLLLTLACAIFLLASTAVLYRYLERLSFEAYVPTYIEVPVLIEKWRSAASEEAATSSAPLID